MVDSKQVSVVVQGPIVRSEILRTDEVCASVRAHFPDSELIVSTWEGEDTGGLDCDQVIFSADPGNLPFDLTVNRQIVSSRAGIRCATRPLVLKTRSDILFTSGELLSYWGQWTERVDDLKLFEQRVLVPHVYTRRPSFLYPTAFHPSDWCFFGLRGDVESLFDIPLMAPEDSVRQTSHDPLTQLFWWWSDQSYHYAAEQYIWVSALGARFPGPAFEQFFHLTPESLRQTELSFANNLVVLDAYSQFGLLCPKYADTGRAFHDHTLLYHADWLRLYDAYCQAGSAPSSEEIAESLNQTDDLSGWSLSDPRLNALRKAGHAWEAMLVESALFGPDMQRDSSTGRNLRPDTNEAAAQMAVAALSRSRAAAGGQTVCRARTRDAANLDTISWSAPLFDPSGYSEEARAFLLALDRSETQVSASPIRWSDRVAVLDRDEESRLIAMVRREHAPGSVHVSHILAPHFTRRDDACINIGRTMFETDRLPDGWADACNRMDRVWVPSEFNRETFSRAGVDAGKLRVVPGAIDASKYDMNCAPLRIDGARQFNFLSVFDWTLRKGWDILVRAFAEEFGGDEDVALIIKTHSSLGYSLEQIVGQVSIYLQSIGMDPDRIPDIIFQDTNLPAPRMKNLYRAADCFVLPSHGEGWGRPYMEAMTMGLPTIGTNWSGNTAFMTAENSLLLECEVVDVPEAAWRETPTFRGHRWAEPSLTHLRTLMRHCFANRREAAEIGQRARTDIIDRFSPERIAAIIRAEVKDVRATATAIEPPRHRDTEDAQRSNSATGVQGVKTWLNRQLAVRCVPENPLLLEIDGVQGFLSPGDLNELIRRAQAVPAGGVIVEIGSFMGLSACAMAHGLLMAENVGARIHCVDTWNGSEEHQELDVIRNAQLFDRFRANIERVGVEALIVPVRKGSVEAADGYADASVDLLFVDGDHSFAGCYADLTAWYPKLKPTAVLIGHDCAPESGVREAVERFADENGLDMTITPPPASNYIFEIRRRIPTAVSVAA